MAKNRKLPTLRVAGPTLLVSGLLFAACIVAAMLLYRLHARSAEDLTEDIDSRKIAADLETTLRNLAALVRRTIAVKQGSDQVDALNDHVTQLLEEARLLANTQTEEALEHKLEASFERYHILWQERVAHLPSGRPELVEQALGILENETLPLADQLRNYNWRQIEKSRAALGQTVKWIAWSLVAVGCIGSLAGIFLGYSVARTLRSAIYKLSVRLRDASHKLKLDLPTVTVTQSDGMDYLHEQMQGLMRQIEQTVERLQQRDREVLRAEQMAAVGQLAAGVAHELRNPLTAVKMLVQSSREDLEKRGLPAEDLQVIEQEIRRLERSLQTFLDFARPPRMERRRLDVGQVIVEALALVKGRARQQHVDCTLHLPEDAFYLEADGAQLRQLVLNLAMNALDAMPHGGCLTLDLKRTAQGEALLRVTDTGPGIDPEIQPLLFQPFVTGKEAGLGLGLVVSRRIAEEHGGSLDGVNLPGGGACFTLLLPAAAAQAA